MDRIKLRQICFLYAALMPVTRTLLLPATLAYHAGNDLLLPAFANFAAEGIVIFLVMQLSKRTKLTFFGLLENTFGRVAARIVYGVFALFFALSAVLPMLEQKGFVTQVLYENAPTVLSFAPFFAVGLFACLKGFRSIGRICDLALPVFVVCYAVLMLLALPYADLSELLPAGQNGAGILRGWVYGLTRYTDCLYPLFFLGHFDYEKGGTAKMMGAFAFGTAAAMFFLAVFYGIFSDIAVLQQNALAQISKYTTAFTLLGRVDLIFIIAMTLLLVFAMCVPLQMCTHCVCESLRCEPALPALVLNLLMLALAVMLNYSFREVQTLYAEKLWIVFAVLCYAVPAAALLLRRKRKGEKK